MRTTWYLPVVLAAALLGGAALNWPAGRGSVARAQVNSFDTGKTVKVELNVQEKTVNVLGVPTNVWTYNGTIPGPIVRLNVGDTLEMTLNNTHNLPHALHTHFMNYPISEDGSSMTAPVPVAPHQNDDPVGAGAGGMVPGVGAQPGPPAGVNPIGPYDPRKDEDSPRPGQSKTYTWKMLDVGAIWYHCHVMEATNHIAKGLFGMVIVYPKGWTWEELPPDPGYGNTKGYAINPKGERLREDVVIMSEINQADNSLVGLAANGGLAGGTNLANYRAWNDPYHIGPFKPGEKGLIFAANIGESGKSWHLHGHHWYRLWQIWHPWQGYPAWQQTNDTEVTPSGTEAPPFDPNPFTPVAELAHARWVAPGEIMPTLIRAGEPGFWFGHDHVVPQAYLGMVPWLVVEDPNKPADAATPSASPAPAPPSAPHSH
jgi:hypothetical protein